MPKTATTLVLKCSRAGTIAMGARVHAQQDASAGVHMTVLAGPVVPAPCRLSIRISAALFTCGLMK